MRPFDLESASFLFHMTAKTHCDSTGHREPRVLSPLGLWLAPSANDSTPQTRGCP